MLVEGLKGIETTKMFDIIHDLYYAGYKAECSLTKEEPKLSHSDFEYYVLSGDESTAGKLISDYLKTINVGEPGEPGAQTN